MCVDLAQAALGGNYGQIVVRRRMVRQAIPKSIAVLLNVLPTGSALPGTRVAHGSDSAQPAAGAGTPTGSVTLSNPNASAINFTTATVTRMGPHGCR